jgi:hypothetical protein
MSRIDDSLEEPQQSIEKAPGTDQDEDEELFPPEI